MKGYFEGLIRMTGITPGRGGGTVDRPGPKGHSAAPPQPVHVEETTFVDTPSPVTTAGPEPRETPTVTIPPAMADMNINNDRCNDRNNDRNNLTGPVIAGQAGEQAETVDIQPVRQEPRPGKRAETAAENPIPLIETHRRVTVENVRSTVKGDETTDAVREEKLPRQQQAEQTAADVPAFLEQEETVVVDGSGRYLDSPAAPLSTGTPDGSPVTAAPAESEPGHRVEKRDVTVRTNQGTILKDAFPLQENRQFSLSIGTINVTIEEPLPPAVVQTQPPSPMPVQPVALIRRQPAKETAPARLGRHYIRMHG